MLLTIVKSPHRELLYIDGVFTADKDHFSTDSLIEYTFGDLNFELENIHYNKDLRDIPQNIEDLPD